MKILILSLTLPPENSATANLIGKLAGALREQGHTVDGLTLRQKNAQVAAPELLQTVYCAENAVPGPKGIRKRIGDLYLRVLRRLPCWWRKGAYHEEEVRPLVRAMDKYALGDYDVILGVCAYYSAIEAAIRYKKKSGILSKIALLQVDPLTDNEAYPKGQYKKRKRYEKRLYKVCDHVFTTPILYQKCEGNGFSVERTTAAEFPLVCEPRITSGIEVAAKQPSEIRCVFAGFLYPNIRDARYTLELFSAFTDPNIRLYVLGTGQEALLDEYANGALAGRLVRLGAVSSEESAAWMDSADVLVNIGNSVTNQVPSKIFDYISRGKCILNTCKSEACPTLAYMNRYALAVNVIEQLPLASEIAERVQGKLTEKSGLTVPFSEIEQVFEACTPRYVAEQITTALS